eukprot:CAMPEP_0174911214 /NCGR_PEP_ID=MMETSP0167-20121228/75814_1 /TAXON_ID=38298 /ORGANISM="Rhodella maculata, Strain CCMP736" /LENGTH=147 /DNA_ID=CAMNT_0016155667 /DNA_START=122 /DNA_END=565 /DNA_ORIENTATION=+
MTARGGRRGAALVLVQRRRRLPALRRERGDRHRAGGYQIDDQRRHPRRGLLSDAQRREGEPLGAAREGEWREGDAGARGPDEMNVDFFGMTLNSRSASCALARTSAFLTIVGVDADGADVEKESNVLSQKGTNRTACSALRSRIKKG